MAYNIGPKIGIDGEREFRDSIKKINDTYKALEAETRAVTAAFEANGDEQGKLEANAKQLQKQIEKQKEKIDLLQDAVKKASDKYGENSIEAIRLRGALYDAQACVADLENELKETNSRLDKSEAAMEDFGEAVDDAGDKAIDFGDVLKANVISDVIMDGLRELGECVKEFVSGSIEEAAGMQAVTAQVEQTFGTMGEVAGDKLEEISDDVNIATTRMQESFTKIYAFAKTSGASAEGALTISSRAMVVAADTAAYYDKSIEEATETLQSFLKGNYENDAALGIACTETTRNTKANELYAKSFVDLSESQKIDVLLAMVEAGNEASGAIGQAARESDSWENVLGELSEVMRLLQVEAGKPALKKLVPIIKDITDAGYELIDDIDWDEFADTVEDIAEGVIEHGPGVVKAIASVTAAIVAMKAVQKAEQLAGIVTSFVGIGTAATTTAQTVAATGLAASATPWGAVALVIGGAAALITAYALQADTDAQKLSDAMDSLQDRMQDANEKYQEAKSEIDGAASAASYYVDRLKELEDAGLDTAVAHKEYEMIVEQLNELLPELNLTIDEQTGLIEQNVDALKEEIEALKRSATQQAMQERFTDILKAQGKAEAALLESQAKLNLKSKEALELEEARVAAYEAFEDASDAVAKATEELATATQQGGEAEGKATAKLEEAKRALEDKAVAYQEAIAAEEANADSMRELSEEIEKGKDVLASYSGEMELANEMATLFDEGTSGLTNAQVELNQKIEDVQNALNSLEMAYADAYAEASESIGKQIDLFGDLAEESDYSADKVIENWKLQQQAMLNYADNLQKAAEMGLSSALIEQLSDGSEQSMLILEQWASGTESEIARINAAFEDLMDGKAVVADTITEIKYGFDEQFSEIEKTAEQSGLQIIDGIVSGIEKGKPMLSKAMSGIATITVDTYNKKMEIYSPARRMIPSGENVVGGVVEGVEENISKLEASMEKLAFAGQNAFNQQQLERAAEYPAQVTVTGSTQQNKVEHHYGNVSVQIYPTEGQNADEIAEVVIERLQTEIERKEAGW